MEITMECNPDDVTGDFCETLKQLPINRISMGAQTFCNERLRFLHRRHNAGEVEKPSPDSVTSASAISVST